MKIDPVTGKAYLQEWQRNLDRLHHAGFSYGYIEIVDLATGEHSWQVDAMKGDGPRVVVEMPTLDGAAKELIKILQTGVDFSG
jgi:hypothetical protein